MGGTLTGLSLGLLLLGTTLAAQWLHYPMPGIPRTKDGKPNLSAPAGHPHSDELHVMERFRRPDFWHMEVKMTIDDPKTYTKPWTATIRWDFLPDTELLDWICENEKDFQHLVGK